MRALAILAVLVLGGCASSGAVRQDQVVPPEALELPPPPADGAIFMPGQGLALFEDQKARRVGDLLTVLLVERTDAQKKANTATKKETSAGIDGPTLLGRPVTAGGVPILEAELGAKQSFSGGGGSTQSNALSGSLGVIVVRVLPNGTLMVRGNKELTLNQGAETVMVEGLVRPQDIRSDNTLTSDRIANARITYAGKGALADSNSMGWLARFFNSAWSPF